MAENAKKIYPFLPDVWGGGQEGQQKSGYTYKGDAGSWHHDADLLTSFPADMNVGKEAVKSQVLTSIPDVWARMHFVAQALLNKDHPGHTDVYNEWRGLMAMLCFAETYGIRLQFEEIELEVVAGELEVLKPEEKSSSGIKLALSKMLPHSSFRKFWIIIADGEPVGATSPHSFVFAAPDYQAPAAIPWRDSSNRFIDPMPYLGELKGEMGTLMLGCLKSWLKSAGVIVQELPLETTERTRLYARFHEEWFNKIKVNAVPIDTRLSALSLPLLAGKSGMKATVAMPLLGKVTKDVQVSLSEVMISKSALKSDFSQDPPIVYWSEGWQADLLVYGAFRSKNIPRPEGMWGSRLHGDKIPHQWINPAELFFTEFLVRVQLEKGNTLCKGGESYLLPLREQVFDFFDSDFLATHFELEELPDGGAMATLRIPLSSKSEAIIRKSYPVNRQVTAIDRDAVVLWPRLKLTGWKHYYLFARFPEKESAAGWTCEPLGARIIDSSNPPIPPDNDLRSRYWRLERPPQAILYKRGEQTLGMVIPKLDQEPVSTESKWALSLDFGTTNTVIAYRNLGSDENRAEPLHLQGRHLILMSIPEGSAMVFVTSNQFLALDPTHRQVPFPSIYNVFQVKQEMWPFLWGIIPFEQTYFAMGGNYGHFDTGLKWEQSQDALYKVRGFLSQILLMSYLEARARGIKEIELIWTYPSAFERKRRINFDNAWRTIASKLSDESDMAVKMREATGDGADPTTTEGFSVCQYAHKFEDLPDKATNIPHVILDVGGGTTDIGIWQGGKMLCQSSVKVAGNLAAEYVHNSKEFAHFLLTRAGLADGRFESLWTSALEDKTNYAAALGYYYRYHDKNKEVSSAIAMNALATQHVKNAVSLAMWTLVGISFYAGLALRAGIDQRGVSSKIDGVNVLFCGNGSRLLDWLGNASVYQPVLGRALRRGLSCGDEVRIKIKDSGQKKMEVSLGSLHLEVGKGLEVPKATVIVGEEGLKIVDTRTGVGESKDRFFDVASLVESSKTAMPGLVFESELPVLKSLVALYNEIADERGLTEVSGDFMYQSALADIQDAVNRFEQNPDSVSCPCPLAIGINSVATQFIRAS